MEIKKIFPNAITGQDVEGAFEVLDTNKVKIGFVDVETDIFWLKADYEHWEKALLRLLENDVKVMRWEEVENNS